KKMFEDTKQVANSCPTDVIRRFFNHSWQFMDAYWVTLSAKMVTWAVCKQKGHHTVSQSTITYLEAVVGTN
ncbi:hypothetical protein K443DRAFT_106128, partial [Laccaria amethystina LaAM-08-1]